MVYGFHVNLVLSNGSEVDPKGSLWYKSNSTIKIRIIVLKLTPKGHYGIEEDED